MTVPTADERAVETAAAFLRAICAAPTDDTPRLVFADWLDENGRGERAELIRVQCQLEAWGCVLAEGGRHHSCRTDEQRERNEAFPCHDLRRREGDLLNAHGYEWAGPAAEFIGPPKDWPDRFRRGFPAAFHFPTLLAWSSVADRLLAAAPVEEVRCAGWPEPSEAIGGHWYWPRVDLPGDAYDRLRLARDGGSFGLYRTRDDALADLTDAIAAAWPGVTVGGP